MKGMLLVKLLSTVYLNMNYPENETHNQNEELRDIYTSAIIQIKAWSRQWHLHRNCTVATQHQK